jgi:hypothetical protein
MIQNAMHSITQRLRVGKYYFKQEHPAVFFPFFASKSNNSRKNSVIAKDLE